MTFVFSVVDMVIRYPKIGPDTFYYIVGILIVQRVECTRIVLSSQSRTSFGYFLFELGHLVPVTSVARERDTYTALWEPPYLGQVTRLPPHA